MNRSQPIVDDILRQARITGAHRRDDLAEELRAHLEDLAERARQHGLDGDALREAVATDFGDPAVIARQFSDVYRRERVAIMAVGCGALSLVSLVVAGLLVSLVQIWSAVSLGFMPRQTLSFAHLDREGLLLAGLTLGYLGLFLCGRQTRSRLLKPTGLTGLVALPFLVALAAWRPAAALILAVALVCAIAVRAIEVWIAPATVRYAGLLVFFWAIGGVAHARMSGSPDAAHWLMVLPMCAAIALACQCTMSLANLFDRRVLPRRLV